MGKVVDFSRPSQPPRKPRRLYVTIEDCGNRTFNFQTNAAEFENEEAGRKVLLEACQTYAWHFAKQESDAFRAKLDAAHKALPWWRRMLT